MLWSPGVEVREETSRGPIANPGAQATVVMESPLDSLVGNQRKGTGIQGPLLGHSGAEH
jgi:hypothetical protein